MRKVKLISGFLMLVLILPACNKDKTPSNSGTITIDDVSYQGATWYNYGFSIPTGEKVSTINDPKDVITIMADGSTEVGQLFFSTINLYNSFFKYGEYDDGNAASAAFVNLKTFTVSSWTETGDSIRANQIWLYRTHDEKYAKIRVISTFAEIRANMPYPYAECKFEWVYQPDGTKIFP